MKREKLLALVVLGTMALFTLGLLNCYEVRAQERVKIGGIVDLTGPTNVIGVPYANGIEDYFAMVNEEGGINGRKIDYFPIDYQYKLPQAMAAYKRLVAQQKVIALLGWGTGDSKARIPLVNRDKLPQIQASWAEDHVDPLTRYNFTAVASYADEIKIMLQYAKKHPVVKGRKVRVAYVYADAEYARSPIRRVKKEKYAQKIGLELVDEEIVSQSATEAVSQLLTLKKAKPDYTILVLTSKPASVVLKDIKKVGIKTNLMGFFYLGDYSLLKLVGDAAKGLMVATPYAFGSETDVPGIRKIWEFNKKHHPERKVIELQYISGWINAMIMAEGVRRAGNNLTGAGVKEGLETFTNFETGGISKPISFSPTKHKGSYAIKLAVAEPDKLRFRPVTGWLTVEK